MYALFRHCLCSSHGALRDLHSFPTRRSSDLDASKIGSDLIHVGCPAACTASREPEQGGMGPWHGGQILQGSPSDFLQPRRSEEHTSELQSPCNLVCRLLLEKKKTQQKIMLNR